MAVLRAGLQGIPQAAWRLPRKRREWYQPSMQVNSALAALTLGLKDRRRSSCHSRLAKKLSAIA